MLRRYTSLSYLEIQSISESAASSATQRDTPAADMQRHAHMGCLKSCLWQLLVDVLNSAPDVSIK